MLQFINLCCHRYLFLLLLWCTLGWMLIWQIKPRAVSYWVNSTDFANCQGDLLDIFKYLNFKSSFLTSTILASRLVVKQSQMSWPIIQKSKLQKIYSSFKVWLVLGHLLRFSCYVLIFHIIIHPSFVYLQANEKWSLENMSFIFVRKEWNVLFCLLPYDSLVYLQPLSLFVVGTWHSTW